MRLIIGVIVVLAGSGCSVGVQTSASAPAPSQQQESVWVCHGNRNPRWQRVAAPAADAHRRHGDRATSERQEEGGACDNRRRGN